MIRTKQPVDKFTGKQIKIIKVLIEDGIYKNLFPNTIHTIIKPPGITPNSLLGVWIYNESKEIVYLIRQEYEYYFKNNNIKRTK
jgi:hypothetical protein